MKLTQLLPTLLIGVSLLAAPQPASKRASDAKAPVKGSGKAASAAAPVDISSAAAGQLAALPGIGKAYSRKNIKGRPYSGKNLLPASIYSKNTDKIIAKQQ
jgi:competence protein ComEA